MSITDPAEELSVSLVVNGIDRRRTVAARTTLADFLRDELLLTGTKLGCEHGVCGACTVLADGISVRSCITLAASVDGAEVTTVEGLADGHELNDLQDSFRRHHGLQCGFCTAGFLMTATDLLDHEPDANEARIRETLSGNLCRCTGYEMIVDAVLAVVRSRREDT
jgi:aerobic-type carbon monoxide dehydrogenase small subunit (CoxS/CutS family)